MGAEAVMENNNFSVTKQGHFLRWLCSDPEVLCHNNSNPHSVLPHSEISEEQEFSVNTISEAFLRVVLHVCKNESHS
jgi:hypothetical protein